ncbi:unnamed protein product [Sphenostylis stenocarpa]|uniref:Uncharacterized protein n=1 Tax=Sphenostylis stenocarpa TaxID=92480 RepID=A0AA86RUZ3_9FABA|nr:unnamed protein product [Sphenostylis stenocarpa]
MQVGNAVAVPVALAMGYTFALACQGLSDDKPLTTLPFKYPSCLARSSFAQTENDDESKFVDIFVMKLKRLGRLKSRARINND